MYTVNLNCVCTLYSLFKELSLCRKFKYSNPYIFNLIFHYIYWYFKLELFEKVYLIGLKRYRIRTFEFVLKTQSVCTWILGGVMVEAWIAGIRFWDRFIERRLGSTPLQDPSSLSRFLESSSTSRFCRSWKESGSISRSSFSLRSRTRSWTKPEYKNLNFKI